MGDVAMETFDICVIASVEKGNRDSGKRLDKLEADFQHRLMCMDAHGGLNIRCEARRGGGKQGNWFQLQIILIIQYTYLLFISMTTIIQ